MRLKDDSFLNELAAQLVTPFGNSIQFDNIDQVTALVHKAELPLKFDNAATLRLVVMVGQSESAQHRGSLLHRYSPLVGQDICGCYNTCSPTVSSLIVYSRSNGYVCSD
jgi:hypothetical protein